MPNMRNTLSTSARATGFASLLIIGIAMKNLVRLQLTVTKYLWPFSVIGNRPTVSIEIVSIDLFGVSVIISDILVCLFALFFWHIKHAST